MENMGRRGFLSLAVAGATLATAKADLLLIGKIFGRKKKKVPMIHVTDLYRPHCDPDDHWDLASVFALAYQNEVDLKAVLIDYPMGKVVEKIKDRNPDVLAVSQMNYITGLSVPVVAGTPFLMKSRQDTLSCTSSSQFSGINAVLNILRKSEKPVAIHVVGCCRDIAVAGKKEPKLFEKKCKAIYLNAGNSSKDLWKGSRPGEYNVSLDTISYAAMFDLPCKIYWMPCVGYINKEGKRILNEYRTMYTINQGEILGYLSDRMQNYFAYMFGVVKTSDWLTFLNSPRQEEIINMPKSQKDKNMWCTAGFFHTAGKTVLADGKVMPIEKAKDKAIFSFEPVKITCSDNGITKWFLDKNSKDRFIFHIRDTKNYESAMAKALKEILTAMP